MLEGSRVREGLVIIRGERVEEREEERGQSRQGESEKIMRVREMDKEAVSEKERQVKIEKRRERVRETGPTCDCPVQINPS